MKSLAVLILLAIMLFILIVGIKIYKKTMSEKTAMEKDAINKVKAPTLFEHKSPSGRCFILQLKGYRGYL